MLIETFCVTAITGVRVPTAAAWVRLLGFMWDVIHASQPKRWFSIWGSDSDWDYLIRPKMAWPDIVLGNIKHGCLRLGNGVFTLKNSNKPRPIKNGLRRIVRRIVHSNCSETGLMQISIWFCRVPTRTGKMGRHFPVREKSGNFDQTGKVRENHTIYWKTEGISDKYFMSFFSDS